jgi:hypothetical protein
MRLSSLQGPPNGTADQYAPTRPPRGIARALHRKLTVRLAFKPADVRRRAQSLTDVACRCDGRERNGETESPNKEKKNKPRGHNALTDKVTPFGQSLRWRSQFTPQPARCFPRFYRIDKLDHPLMNVYTSGAFECSDVKAERARRDPCQHRSRFAFRTWWSVKRAHDAVPYIRREHKTSQSPVDARDRPVMHYFAVSIPSAKLGMDMRRHEFIALVRRQVGRLSRECSVKSGSLNCEQ